MAVPVYVEKVWSGSVWGSLFGYRGRFNVEWHTVTAVPGHILSKRQERRD